MKVESEVVGLVICGGFLVCLFAGFLVAVRPGLRACLFRPVAGGVSMLELQVTGLNYIQTVYPFLS
jgi:hypothetical protein